MRLSSVLCVIILVFGFSPKVFSASRFYCTLTSFVYESEQVVWVEIMERIDTSTVKCKVLKSYIGNLKVGEILKLQYFGPPARYFPETNEFKRTDPVTEVFFLHSSKNKYHVSCWGLPHLRNPQDYTQSHWYMYTPSFDWQRDAKMTALIKFEEDLKVSIKRISDLKAALNLENEEARDEALLALIRLDQHPAGDVLQLHYMDEEMHYDAIVAIVLKHFCQENKLVQALEVIHRAHSWIGLRGMNQLSNSKFNLVEAALDTSLLVRHRAAAIMALGMHWSMKASNLKRISPLLEDPSPEIRRITAILLGSYLRMLGTEDQADRNLITEPLFFRWGAEKNLSVRNAIAYSLMNESSTAAKIKAELPMVYLVSSLRAISPEKVEIQQFNLCRDGAQLKSIKLVIRKFPAKGDPIAVQDLVYITGRNAFPIQSHLKLPIPLEPGCYLAHLEYRAREGEKAEVGQTPAIKIEVK